MTPTPINTPLSGGRSPALIATLMLAFVLGGPVRGDADEVLVPGKPPLTRKLMDEYRQYAECVLDIRLTDAQCRKWEGLFIRDFKKKGKAAREKFVVGWGEIYRWTDLTRKLEPAERERKRNNIVGGYVADLLESADEDDKMLVELCSAVHKELIHLGRGQLHLEAKEYDKAIGQYSEAIRLKPKFATAYRDRGVAYVWKKDCDKAIADYSEAIRLEPKDATVYRDRGNAYAWKKDHDKAIADFTEAIRLEPRDAKTYCDRGVAYCCKQDDEKAISDFTEAIGLAPKNARAYNHRGVSYHNKGDFDKAIADYNEAIRLEPKDAAAYCDRGDAFAGKKDYDKAIADYTEAIRLAPKDARAYRSRGNAYLQKALADYEKAGEGNSNQF